MNSFKSFSLSDSCSYRKTPILPLDIPSHDIATYFCCIIEYFIMHIVNNYEISICLYKFLYYWHKKPDTVYIKAPTLFRLLKLQYTPLFKQYFEIYSINLYLI